jgi:hypothetical protein
LLFGISISQLIFRKTAPFRGKPKPGPLGPEFLLIEDIFNMKLKRLSIFLSVIFVLSIGSVVFGASQQTSPSPSAFVPESRYTFPTVLDGVEVTHDFIIQNKGDAELKIEKVKTG